MSICQVKHSLLSLGQIQILSSDKFQVLVVNDFQRQESCDIPGVPLNGAIVLTPDESMRVALLYPHRITADVAAAAAMPR